MLCRSCQKFCEDAAEHVVMPAKEVLLTHPRIQHSGTIHSTLDTLKQSSERLCPICRSIWNSIKFEDIDDLEANCRIDLDITSTVRDPPRLTARFHDSEGALILEKKSFATYFGHLASSRSNRPGDPQKVIVQH